MSRTRLNYLQRLHVGTFDHRPSIQQSAHLLMVLGWHIHSQTPLAQKDRECLLFALNNVLDDDNITKHTERFEGHALLVSCFRAAMYDTKGNYLSAKDAIKDVVSMIESSARRSKQLRRNAVFLKYCIRGMQDMRDFAKSLTVLKREPEPYY